MSIQAPAIDGGGHGAEKPAWAGRSIAVAMVVIPVALVALCFASKFGIIDVPHGPRAWLIFILLMAMMATGMPISIALGLTVLTFLFTMTNVEPQTVALKLFTGIEKFEIMAIPFFILAGQFLTHGGVAKRMIDFASSMIGHLYGGLGLAGVMACALFAAISGSSVATVVAVGSIILPAMEKAGYPKRFGAGVIATSGALGILFPPSLNLVIFAVATSGMSAVGPAGQPVSSPSVGQLFIAGVIPGLLLATALGVTTWYRARANDYPRMQPATWAQRWHAFRESFWGLFLIAFVLGGIYGGLFTPTEAAAMAAVYAFFVAVFVYKDMKLRDVPRVLLNAAALSSMLLYIITNAVLFSFLMTSEQIPQAMAAWMTEQGFGLVVFLLLINVILLAAGNFMDPAAIVLIMAPILFPVAMKLGVHPVHMGILMAVNMEVGLCHPPVGLNLYVASGITKMGITELTIAVFPWLMTMLGFLVLITYVPEITLWLPRLLGML
jgi:C4-dicarboxylate transporter, DctM subunit